MKNKAILHLFAVCIHSLFIGFVSCSESGMESRRLASAESLIWDRPDSALMILREIDTVALKRGKERAQYGLLYTMALDKNHLDPKDVSIILPTVEYYGRGDDMENRIKADYYYSRVLYLREEYPKALVNFFKAKELAEKEEDWFWAGMACRGIADIYMQVSNYADELYYAQKEYDYIKKSGVQPYLNYALLDLAHAYNNNSKHQESLRKVEMLLDSARIFQDENLYYETQRLKGMNLCWLNKFKESEKIFQEICKSFYVTSYDSMFLSMAEVGIGNLKEGRMMLEKVKEFEKPYKNYILYLLFKQKGDSKSALQQMEKLYAETNRITRSSMDINHSSALAEYFELEKELSELRIREQRYELGFILTLISVLFLLLLMFVYLLIRRHKKEVAGKVLLAEELKESLDRSHELNNKNTELLREMLISQYGLIGGAGEILYADPESKVTKRQVVDFIGKIINELSMGGKRIEEMEKKINLVNDGLMTKFRTDFPGLKEQDYLIFMYSVLRFPIRLISLLIREGKVETVYNRKRHLRDRIKKLDSERKEYYLEFL